MMKQNIHAKKKAEVFGKNLSLTAINKRLKEKITKCVERIGTANE